MIIVESNNNAQAHKVKVYRQFRYYLLKDVQNRGRQTINRDVHLQDLRPNRLMHLLAAACKLLIDPYQIMAIVFKHTNLCVYHAWGCCPHQECGFNHGDQLHACFSKFIEAWQLAKGTEKSKQLGQTRWISEA
jgi:hypothetical protein